MIIYCENIFCIYWENDKCLLNSVKLDIQGRCDSCIYIDIKEPTLKIFRKSHLNKIENY